MAKVLCILAMASTLSAAPTSDPFYGSRHTTKSIQNANSIVDAVMRSLGPQMDAAIEAAMRGMSRPLSGSAPITSFTGTVSSSPAVSVQLSGSSRGENSQSKWSTHSSSSSKQSNFEAISGFGSNFGSAPSISVSDATFSVEPTSGSGSTSQSNQESVVESVLSQ